jgi:LuxR family transcriptional regulator, maltose regulon positive regulatory protein
MLAQTTTPNDTRPPQLARLVGELLEADQLALHVYDTPFETVEVHSGHTEPHASLISEIARLLVNGEPSSSLPEWQHQSDGLSVAEARVLRYLPTSLTVSEIADELYLSANTVKTHMRHIYAKLQAHRRSDAVDRARALGLLGSTNAPRSTGGNVVKYLAVIATGPVVQMAPHATSDGVGP